MSNTDDQNLSDSRVPDTHPASSEIQYCNTMDAYRSYCKWAKQSGLEPKSFEDFDKFSGDAGSDTRLRDPAAPTAHAATHETTGVDVIRQEWQ
jgi:hypothetical protein